MLKIRAELAEINESAARSLDEGLEERCSRVDCWKNSNQKQRWLASPLMDIEPRLRRLLGYRHLPTLREAVINDLGLTHQEVRVTTKVA